MKSLLTRLINWIAPLGWEDETGWHPGEPYGDFPNIPSGARPLSRIGPGLASPRNGGTGEPLFTNFHASDPRTER